MKLLKKNTIVFRKELRVSILLFVISLIIGIVIAEIGLRGYINFKNRLFISKEIKNTSYFVSNPKSWNIIKGQKFRKKKSNSTFRIFIFGGSTVEGSIHQGKVSFSKFMEIILKARNQPKSIEIINFGKAGETSKEVLTKVKKSIKYKPDLLIIYSGHNEYIKYDEIEKSILGTMEIFCNTFYLYRFLLKKRLLKFKNKNFPNLNYQRKLEDKRICKKNKFLKIRNDYKKRLKRIVRIAEKHQINLIFCNVAGNYKGWEPNRSCHKNRISHKELIAWRSHFYRGKELQKNKKYRQAIKEYELANSFDNSFAETNYQLGICYEKIENFKKAKAKFKDAVNQDCDPKIASTHLNEYIRKICQNYQIPFVDVITAFEKVAKHSLIGYDIMVDAHHPSMFGQLLIAKEIIKVMEKYHFANFKKKNKLLNGKNNDWYLKNVNFSKKDYKIYHQNRGLWFAKLSTKRFDPKDRIKRAKYHLNKAFEINQKDFKTQIGYAVIFLLEKKQDQAKNKLQDACNINSKGTINTIQDIWISKLLSANGIHVNRKCQFIY
jgi:tetratricopeptide (TPR) repeat protein